MTENILHFRKNKVIRVYGNIKYDEIGLLKSKNPYYLEQSNLTFYRVFRPP